MLPIKQEFLKVARLEHKGLSLDLITLNRFSVLGVTTKRDYDRACEFLGRIGLKYHTDGYSFIWLDNLPKVLKDLFKKQNKK